MHKQYYDNKKDNEQKNEECPDCFGRGWFQTLTGYKKCTTCSGSGKVNNNRSVD